MAASQSRRFNYIKEIDNSKETWRLRVRVIRLYEVPSWINPKETSRIEMVLLDERNDKIQASYKDRLIRHFRPLLHEGELYNISNFVVSENKDNHKSCANKWKITFHKNTSVREISVVELEIPKFGFEFISFQDIQEQKPNPNVFIDIIGVLKGKGRVEFGGELGTPTKKIKIRLENESARTLDVFLWGDYVDLLINYVDTHPGRNVVVIQFAKLKYFNGISSVSNAFHASRLMMNPNSEAISSFIASCGNIPESNAYVIEDLGVTQPLTIRDEFFKLEHRKYIDDFLNIKEPCFCAVVAKIKTVETQHDWCYSSCKICASKVTKQGNCNFYCDKCKKTLKYVTTRFKVVFKVEDDTGSASVLLFCREMVQLIGKSATDLRDTLVKNGEDDLFPMEFDDLLGKQYLFKVNISDYNLGKNYKVYTAARITDDPELMAEHFALLKREEVTEVVSEVFSESVGNSLSLSYINGNEGLSVIGENSEMTSSGACNITPTKRGIEEVVAGELYILPEEGQSSAIRPKMVVKVEKED